jgi:putative serine protease PepD
VPEEAAMSEQDRSGGAQPAEGEAASWWAGGGGSTSDREAAARPTDLAAGADPSHPRQTVRADADVAADPGRPARDRPARVPTGLLVTGAVLVALVAALLGGAAGAWWADRGDSPSGLDRSVALPTALPGSTKRPSGSVAGVAQRVLPSVVSIKVQGADGAGTGSGFIIRGDGYVVTNNHVVEGANGSGSIVVVFPDGSQAPAKVVGADASYDLAAIKVDRKGLPALSFGDSGSVLVGDEVIAIGAPLGLDGTVTTGIVSALNRPVSAGGGDAPAFINAIQTDAAINPGNSGGPLVNLAGEVIAVNSAIARVPGTASLGQSGNIGLGFAIPSQQARRTVQQLIRTGKAQHPVIGVLLDRGYSGQGVRVATTGTDGQRPVTPNGPADKAGIRPGDVITRFDGRPVTEPDQLVVAIRARAPGDTVALTVRTGSRERTVRMTLEAAVD